MAEQITSDLALNEVGEPEPPRRRRLARLFGAVSLKQGEEPAKKERTPTPLPEGYHYAEPAGITLDEEAALKQQVGWDTTKLSLKIANMSLHNRGAKIAKVGVRDEAGQLIGFGSVVYKRSRGELCDLVVRPDDQGKGLGKAIIDESLAKAEERGIGSLYMPYLEPTNPLKSYYLENGFNETSAGEIVRGPDPQSITGVPPQR